ncbi:aminopeptidase P family protein [Sphingomonas morindae]|uniref:Xaa-Pro aminopeptidase n=1 Tax=Sphingomonas morindae TaxID=1541170 RepID=A0ABY4XA16_9SPHN|nr:aminopeptidase P family protein [Sphingomonas morindae]USI73777.1 Xaa-Pro aminopeptidase [Sphingomonas morindae]
MFDTSLYVARRATLAASLTGLGLFPAAPSSPMNYASNHHPYVQDSCFAYYFGLNRSGLVGLIDFDSGESLLFGDDPSLDDLIWLGPKTPLREEAARVGVAAVRPLADLAPFLFDVSRGRMIHYTPPYRQTSVARIGAWLGRGADEVVAGASAPLVAAIVAQREIKSPEEIAEMELALAVTAEMHATAARLARPGVREHVVAGAVEGVARAADRRLAYPVIFSAAGEVLHNDRRDQLLAAGDLVVHDSGATSPLGYAGDITRTLPIGGRFSARQRLCYDLVLAAQKAAIAACRAGTPYLEVHKCAARVLVEGLIAEGLFRGDPQAIVDSGAYALVFQTGVGHQIGLDVHDMEALGEASVGYDESVSRSPLFGLANLRMAKPLRAGMVVTVEPGLYFIPPLIEKWEAEGRHADMIDYARVRAFTGVRGIRIEDDVLVTEDAPRILGPAIPKEAEEMEALLAD